VVSGCERGLCVPDAPCPRGDDDWGAHEHEIRANSGPQNPQRWGVGASTTKQWQRQVCPLVAPIIAGRCETEAVAAMDVACLPLALIASKAAGL
jgi:hypothetical protein